MAGRRPFTPTRRTATLRSRDGELQETGWVKKEMAADVRFPPYKNASVTDLIPYARNARTHSDAQVAQIAALDPRVRLHQPVLVDGESGIIAGHGRLLAARKLGLAEVPVIELSHLSRRRSGPTSSPTTGWRSDAGWDEELLRSSWAICRPTASTSASPASSRTSSPRS